jgi:C_GCAxxG_C_C family probable redox protein
LSFREHFGLKDPDSIIPRLATGFGAGIARKGLLCGALTGAIMVIGMKLGRKHPKDYEAVAKVFGTVEKLWDRFEKEFGGTECHKITGYHLSNTEERDQWCAAGGRQKCHALAEKTAQMLCELLEGV